MHKKRSKKMDKSTGEGKKSPMVLNYKQSLGRDTSTDEFMNFLDLPFQSRQAREGHLQQMYPSRTQTNTKVDQWIIHSFEACNGHKEINTASARVGSQLLVMVFGLQFSKSLLQFHPVNSATSPCPRTMYGRAAPR